MGKKMSLARKSLRELAIFVLGSAIGAVLTVLLTSSSIGQVLDGLPHSGLAKPLEFQSSAVPMEHFPEPQWRTKNTLDIKTITSTPFARFEIHKVRTESGAIVNDWLWTDERSHVNILVHLKEENKYLVFKQTKYGLERPYFATIGGLFNEGETGLECAKRELLEETGLEAEEWVGLGKYRVQVNRGGGILYAYLAKNCVPSKDKKKSDDYEKQDAHKLTRNELIDIGNLIYMYNIIFNITNLILNNSLIWRSRRGTVGRNCSFKFTL
jgi:8-oxo-dGTP pyrophosphatase MutT (NUDIX family)